MLDDDGAYRETGSWRDRFARADQMQAAGDPEARRRRGRDFEKVLRDMLNEAGLVPRTSFRPLGEEIDGSFVHRGRVMLLEAKWTQDPLPASSIYQFRGKVEGKLVGTIGVFISMNGFSEDAVNALVAGKVINTILFNGDDLRAVADGQVDVVTALDRKLRAAAESGVPFWPLRDPVSSQPVGATFRESDPRPERVVVVEGVFDVLLVHALAEALGPPAFQLAVMPVGGTFNLAASADAALATTGNDDCTVVIIADGDGQPDAVRRRIETALIDLSPATADRTQIVVLDPSFEDALGDAEGFAERRPPLRQRDRRSLVRMLRAANLPRMAERNSEIRRLLRALGLDSRHSVQG